MRDANLPLIVVIKGSSDKLTFADLIATVKNKLLGLSTRGGDGYLLKRDWILDWMIVKVTIMMVRVIMRMRIGGLYCN